LEQSGRWFRRSFKVTPATAVVALDDWQHQGRRSVWYDTRYFRVNFYWHGTQFKVRDIHLFNEKVQSPYHRQPDRAKDMAVYTLPIIDGLRWVSDRRHGRRAGIRVVEIDEKGVRVPLRMDGQPVVAVLRKRDLHIRFKFKEGGIMNILCREGQLVFHLRRTSGSTLKWSLEMAWGAARSTGIGRNTSNTLHYHNQGVSYTLVLDRGTMVRRFAAERTILFSPQQDAVILALDSKLIR
jgi:hypothetical protein